jgi:hypothetical protein
MSARRADGNVDSFCEPDHIPIAPATTAPHIKRRRPEDEGNSVRYQERNTLSENRDIGVLTNRAIIQEVTGLGHPLPVMRVGGLVHPPMSPRSSRNVGTGACATRLLQTRRPGRSLQVELP